MSSNEKFQAGEAYGETPKKYSSGFFEDPVQVATALLKDYSGV
jgi:hypothetical protein